MVRNTPLSFRSRTTLVPEWSQHHEPEGRGDRCGGWWGRGCIAENKLPARPREYTEIPSASDPKCNCRNGHSAQCLFPTVCLCYFVSPRFYVLRLFPHGMYWGRFVRTPYAVYSYLILILIIPTSPLRKPASLFPRWLAVRRFFPIHPTFSLDLIQFYFLFLNFNSHI